MKKRIYVAACDLGVTTNGSKNGAEALYEAYKNEDILLNKQDDNYIKDTNPNNKHKNLEELVKYTESIYKDLNKFNKDDFVMLLGGDHSVAVPSVLSSVNRNGKLGVIWFDAHTDYHTLVTTNSGNLHGTPCATINGHNAELSSFHNGDYIKEENTVIFGARSIDSGEKDNLNNRKVTVITMDEIKKNGIEASLNKAFDIAGKGTSGIHISYDIDFIDPSVAKGVSTPVKDGALIQDVDNINKILVNNIDKIKSMDVVEYNSLADDDLNTYKITKKIIDNILDNK